MMRRCSGSVIVPIVRFDQHRHEYEVYQPNHRITEIKAIQKRTKRERERERGEHLHSPAMELHLTFDIPKTRCLPTEFCALILSQYCISVKTNCFFAAFIIYVHKFVLRRCSRCVINVSNVHHLYC